MTAKEITVEAGRITNILLQSDENAIAHIARQMSHCQHPQPYTKKATCFVCGNQPRRIEEAGFTSLLVRIGVTPPKLLVNQEERENELFNQRYK